MSAEVVKKRGRPKKVVSESTPVESIEPVKKGTRQKSTKASAPASTTAPNKSAKASEAIPEDPLIASVAVQKKTGRVKTSSIAANAPSSSWPTVPPDTTSEPLPIAPIAAVTSPIPKATSANSKILNQVRALSSTAPPATKKSPSASKSQNLTSPTSPNAAKVPSQINAAKSPLCPPSSLPNAEQEPPTPSEPNVLSNSTLKQSPRSSPTEAQPQQTQRTIPLAALNSTIVSQISSRAGARPSRPPNALPPNYKPVARRVTMAIVALPIAVVTSWVLYQRLVLGEERKQLVRPGMVMVDESPSIREPGGIVSEKDT